MPHSQNGWLASPHPADLHVAPLIVGGVNFSPGLAHHDYAAVVLEYVFTQYHLRVEKLRKGWCWGYYFRANRNDPDSLSNHASATAGDANAPLHPNGRPASVNFTPKQIAEIHKIIAELTIDGDPAVRWGGDYVHTVDAMHWELLDMPTVAKVGKAIRDGRIKPGKPVILKPRATARKARQTVRVATGAKTVNINAVQRLAKANQDVRDVQKVLNAWFPQGKVDVDGLYGDESYDKLEFARDHFRIAGHVSDRAVRAKVLRKMGLKAVFLAPPA